MRLNPSKNERTIRSVVKHYPEYVLQTPIQYFCISVYINLKMRLYTGFVFYILGGLQRTFTWSQKYVTQKFQKFVETQFWSDQICDTYATPYATHMRQCRKINLRRFWKSSIAEAFWVSFTSSSWLSFIFLLLTYFWHCDLISYTYEYSYMFYWGTDGSRPYHNNHQAIC